MRNTKRVHAVLRSQPPATVLTALVMVCILTGPPSFAQDVPRAGQAADPRLTEQDNAYLNRHAKALLDQVDKVFERTRPQLPEPLERRLALLLLDAVLHDVYAPNRPPVQDFYHARMNRAVESMEHTSPAEGAMIWKLYNHGFVVRTATVTLAFDLHRGPAAFRVEDPEKGRTNVPCQLFRMSDASAERLVQQCDVLFVSHRHGDHADPWVAEAFLNQNKPVVAPADVFESAAFHARITHLKREAHTLQQLPIQDGARELQVVVYPGQQYQGRGTPNNVALVLTPEGMSFAHNGDQINDPYPEYQEDYKWIDRVREHHRVDVLMTNCWLNDIYRFTRGFNPKLVIPGHENELSHPVNDRVPYWRDSEYLELTFPQLLASDYPVLTMSWGESYHYIPQAE